MTMAIPLFALSIELVASFESLDKKKNKRKRYDKDWGQVKKGNTSRPRGQLSFAPGSPGALSGPPPTPTDTIGHAIH